MHRIARLGTERARASEKTLWKRWKWAKSRRATLLELRIMLEYLSIGSMFIVWMKFYIHTLIKFPLFRALADWLTGCNKRIARFLAASVPWIWHSANVRSTVCVFLCLGLWHTPHHASVSACRCHSGVWLLAFQHTPKMMNIRCYL